MSETPRPILGLDIGGANLKAAHSNGEARIQPFPLWKDPGSLEEQLRRLVVAMPEMDEVALTMTGEMCDCFANQAEGVRFILEGVMKAIGAARLRVFTLDGDFVTLDQARQRPERVAAANWLAQAIVAARLAPNQTGLLIDIGSTTTDIIPLVDGKPMPRALTDPARLEAGELVYTGARRTPICAVLGAEVAAEFFATMGDVYLALGEVPPQPESRDTADGRPATMAAAHARLARMVCADPATLPKEKTRDLARRARARQAETLKRAIQKVSAHLTRRPEVFITSGSGAFVAGHLGLSGRRVDLATEWGATLASCACAWSAARLASERG